MNKLRILNLALIVTERCNLNCAHCLRGGCSNKVMSDKVIEATLDQFDYIQNLTVCGGEPTLSLDRVEKVFSYIVEHKIVVESVSITINGTIYSCEFLRLLDYVEDYLQCKDYFSPAIFAISWDKFHHAEIDRLNMRQEYIENVKKYMENKHFYALRQIEHKLFREGNAVELDPNLTVPFRPMPIIMSYYTKGIFNIPKFDRTGGNCYIGPLISVNVDGIVTECDVSLEHQRTLYNYGNVLTNSIEEICLRQNPVIVKPRRLNRKLNRAMKIHMTYDK